MMTSGGRGGDPARNRALGIAASLTTPVEASELLNTMQRVLGAAPRRPPARESRPGRRLRVLLAEDNAVNQRVAARMIEKLGHQVEVANNGVQAVEKFQQKAFDLVLMDVQMPEMDGFQATAAIRKLELRQGKHTPIIAMTAHALPGDRERCLEARMDGYIAKPVHVDDLFREIERVTQLTA
jgi:CheY-like chemotaxis protein